MLTSLTLTTGAGSQLSVAVTVAAAGTASQFTVTAPGIVPSRGAVTSWTVMIWEPEVALPATSVAVKVLVIV